MTGRFLLTVVLGLAGLYGPQIAHGQTKTFTQRFEVEVPARGAFGAPPKRTGEFEFKLPSTYKVVRDGTAFGATAKQVNFGGLTEVDRKFTSIDNGVKLTWELKNEESFPVGGRTAFVILELKGERSGSMSLSPRYTALRKRALDKFYFQGRVAEYIDLSVPGGKVKFADQTIYLGQALMAFATEVAVLKDAGQDTADALAKIKELMDAVEELDRKGDKPFGGPDDALNGFFVRDDITGKDDPRLMGRFAVAESDFQDPSKENASPSGDQIFGLMTGLYCVVKYAGDDGLSARAKAIASRLYDYARRSFFVLKLPDGEPTRRGSDMRWLASLLHGVNKATTGEDQFDRSRIKVAGQPVRLNGIAAFWDSPRTASSVERLAGESIRVPVVNKEFDLNSFALHILFMSLAPGEVWDQGELEKAAVKANHHLSVLLYCQAHGTHPQRFDETAVQRMLDACPNSGPRASLDPSTGWARDNRWVRCTNIFEPAGGSEEYNGVDWLVLHNLHQLVFGGK